MDPLTGIAAIFGRKLVTNLLVSKEDREMLRLMRQAEKELKKKKRQKEKEDPA